MIKSTQHNDFRRSKFSINELCTIMDISRQAFYKRRKNLEKELLEEELILQEVIKIRRMAPRLGGRKIYYLIKGSDFPLSVGRDRFFKLLRDNKLLIRPRKQYVRTTQSNHYYRVYSNMIKELEVNKPGEVLVSDITYLRSCEGYGYLFLVTDVYSRKIVGYHLSKTLETKDALIALKMALEKIDNRNTIHHSDRGIQYCSNEYTKLLKSYGIKISMGEAGNPYDNAIAERLNGILKYEFNLNIKFASFRLAGKAVDEAVDIYNSFRPHLSLNYLTPDQKFVA